MSTEKMSTAIKGAIGEFYVASFLSAMGLVVALPRGGVPSSDLLVTTFEGNKTLSLQVKTSLSPINKSKKYFFIALGFKFEAKLVINLPAKSRIL